MKMLDSYMVANILYRVPIRHVSEIRYVCKQWHAIISDPNFSKLHHQPTEILTLSLTPNGLKLCFLDLENKDRVHVSDIDFPLKIRYPVKDVSMIGSCNGLVCFRIDKQMLLLCNSCTNQYRTLPSDSDTSYFSCSFGYDPVHDDCKVVCLQYLSIKIYSLKSNTWNHNHCPRIDSKVMFNTRLNDGYHVIYLNGSFHYLLQELTAFSLAEEKFVGMVPMPDDFDVDVREITVLDDCLCICQECSTGDTIQVWVMKEYMEKGSWSKLCTILRNQIPNRNYSKITPICTSQDGHLLFTMGENRIVEYNMKRNIRTADRRYMSSTRIFLNVWNLVSLLQ